jgi:hypothetical protein
VPEFLARAIKQDKGIKEILREKKEVRLPIFADNMILYLKDPKDSTRKLLDMINTFSKLAEYKITI